MIVTDAQSVYWDIIRRIHVTLVIKKVLLDTNIAMKLEYLCNQRKSITAVKGKRVKLHLRLGFQWNITRLVRKDIS